MTASTFRRGGWWHGKVQLDTWLHEKRFTLGTRDKRVAQAKFEARLQDFEREAAGLQPARSVLEAAKCPLPDLVKQFIEDMTARDRAAGTVRKYALVLRRLCEACGWTLLPQVTAASFCDWRKDCRLRARTMNHYLAAACVFLRWLKRRRLLMENPLEFVDPVDLRRSAREYRGALTAEQVSRLLHASPATRATFYRLILETGIRPGEVRRLRVADIILANEQGAGAKGAPELTGRRAAGQAVPDVTGRNPTAAIQSPGLPAGASTSSATPSTAGLERMRGPSDCAKRGPHERVQGPSVRVPASIAKNGKTAVQSISARLAGELAALLPRDAHPNAFAFPRLVPLCRTFRKDLLAAGIASVDGQGRRVDLHALRKTFGTHLVLSGADPRVVMEAMRHSDLKLTMKTYMDAAQLQGPVLVAVAKLPWNAEPLAQQEGTA